MYFRLYIKGLIQFTCSATRRTPTLSGSSFTLQIYLHFFKIPILSVQIIRCTALISGGCESPFPPFLPLFFFKTQSGKTLNGTAAFTILTRPKAGLV